MQENSSHFFLFAELIEHALTNQSKDVVKKKQSGAETCVGFSAFTRAIPPRFLFSASIFRLLCCLSVCTGVCHNHCDC